MSSEPVVIRVWDWNRKHLGHCIAVFDKGFSIPAEHPLAAVLSRGGHLSLSVLSTNEVEWHVERVEVGAFHRPFCDEVRVSCIPHVEKVRRGLLSDESFLENLNTLEAATV